MRFASKIRELRENQQILQRRVSAALDIDNAMYCKIEKGERTAKREQVLKLAEILNADKDELLKLWLSDKVYEIVSDEDVKNDVLTYVAENIVEYERRK